MKAFACSILIVLTAATAAFAQTPAWPAELDAYIEKARTDWEVPGLSVTVVRDGKLLVAKGYGVRTLGRPERVDENTMFDIASVSKSFTAAAIATLVDEGKMHWDDPVRRWLPQVEFSDPYRTANVTIRDLLCHRVGVEQGNFLFRFTGYTTDEVLRRMRYLKEKDAFRTTMIYSNVGYTAAGEAAAAAAGMPFTELLRTRLLEPLGMTASTIGVPHTASPNHASPHGPVDGIQRPIDHTKALNILPADAINSTPLDIAKWMLFQLGDGTWNGKTLISKASMTQMHEPQNIIATTPDMRANRGVQFFAAYALGWQVMDYRGHKLIWHSGSGDGMPVYMALLPDEHIGVMVMINTWNAPVLHGTIAAKIFDVLLGLPSTGGDTAAEAAAYRKRTAQADAERRALDTPPAPIAKPSRPLDAYAGTYVDPLYGEMHVTLVNGALVLQFARGERADLKPWQYDTFRVAWRDRVYEDFDTFATFSLDAHGTPHRFDMQLNRDNVEATRSQ
ncbi:MAG: serine hydrolase [Acidobacteria bacterium]|nr:serine hydrolase [Acidobacteriota bacterium]MBV9474924.1 serine hydrolase [Acidobacteriota bacterium]